MAPVKNYTPLQMSRAIDAVKKGESVSSAARKYGVPRITLYNKTTGKSPAVCAMGPSSVLNKDEEIILVQWLFAMSERHCPVAKEQLLDSVQLIVKLNGKETPFTEGRPGRKWFHAFLKRHPEVSERLSQNLTTSRDAVTQEQIINWFSEVHEYIKHNSLKEVLNDPSRVFNTDESAFFLNPNPSHVLVRKGDKNVYSVSGNEKENLTVLITANAAGQFAPPMIVFAYERVPKHIADSVPDSWAIGKSENGWMCSSTFYEYVTNVFQPWLIQNKITLPVILFLDGHASHLTKPLSDFCSASKIEIIALYPNSTHLLQPMDLAVFKPLKAFWRKHVRKWKTENLGQQVKKENFAPILKCALEDVTPDSVKNGFRAGGLFPFGPDYVDFSKMHAHNRRLTDANQPLTSQEFDFFAKLEQEIVKTFTQSKLDLYEKCFYTSRTALNDVLPAEDLTLYTIWAKYKHNLAGTSTNTYVIRQDDTDQRLVNITQKSPIKDTPLPSLNQELVEITQKARLKDMLLTSLDQGTVGITQKTPQKDMPSTSTQKTPIKDMSLMRSSDQTLVNITHNTPMKDMLSTSFANYMLKEKNILIPSPFKKGLFWPEPTTKKKGRLSKEKLPSAISSKAWKEFHVKKDLNKKNKEEEKEKRKQERLEKMKSKSDQMIIKKKRQDKLTIRKRRKHSVTSSDTEDSDITYAESGESDLEQRDNSENDRNFENTNYHQSCIVDGQLTTEVIQTEKETGEDAERRKDEGDERRKTVQEHKILMENVCPEQKIQILDNVDVQMVLDDKTGTFKVTTSQCRSDEPEVGKYVLVRFNSESTKKTYRYVCVIQEIFGENIVVQGLRSKKSKKTFKIVENDISIIDKTDILNYLPKPIKHNDNFIFPYVIDVKELI